MAKLHSVPVPAVEPNPWELERIARTIARVRAGRILADNLLSEMAALGHDLQDDAAVLVEHLVAIENSLSDLRG